jgi:hypothetical protein
VEEVDGVVMGEQAWRGGWCCMPTEGQELHLVESGKPRGSKKESDKGNSSLSKQANQSTDIDE